MNPQAHIRSLPCGLQAACRLPASRERAGARSVRAHPPEGAECRGSMPACAGMDGTRRRCVSQRRGLQGQASLGTARQES